MKFNYSELESIAKAAQDADAYMSSLVLENEALKKRSMELETIVRRSHRQGYAQGLHDSHGGGFLTEQAAWEESLAKKSMEFQP